MSLGESAWGQTYVKSKHIIRLSEYDDEICQSAPAIETHYR